MVCKSFRGGDSISEICTDSSTEKPATVAPRPSSVFALPAHPWVSRLRQHGAARPQVAYILRGSVTVSISRAEDMEAKVLRSARGFPTSSCIVILTERGSLRGT